MEEIEEILPQLCHLVMTKPDGAVFIEAFLTTTGKKSLHMAILTLWYMESYYTEYHSLKKIGLKARAYRMIMQLQKILSNTTKKQDAPRNKVFPCHTSSFFTGIGCILSSIGQPRIYERSIDQALAIGKNQPWPEIYLLAPSKKEKTKSKSWKSKISGSSAATAVAATVNANTTAIVANASGDLSSTSNMDYSVFATPPLEEFHNGGAFSLHRYLKKLHKSYVLSDNAAVLASKLSALGSGLNSGSKDAINSKPGKPDNATLIEKDKTDSYFDQGHHYHSEMEFIQSLISISARLSRIPKEARPKALKAELNLLNHNLPANICIPLWCDKKENNDQQIQHHHKIVHLPPHDAIVLNSAERVPFLILVEILENEPVSSLPHLIANKTKSRIPLSISSSSVNAIVLTPEFNLSAPCLRSSYPGNGHSSKEIPNDAALYDKISKITNPNESVLPNVSLEDKTIFGDKKTLEDISIFEEKNDGSIESTRECGNETSDIPVCQVQVSSCPDDPCMVLTIPLSEDDPIQQRVNLFTQITSQNESAKSPDAPVGISSYPENPEDIFEAVDLNVKKPMPDPKNHPFDFAERMRTAAILLAQLQDIMTKSLSSSAQVAVKHARARIIKEMESLEVQRLTHLAASGPREFLSSAVMESSDGRAALIGSSQDPLAPASSFAETWEQTEARIRKDSPYGHLPNWRLLSVIVKSGADLRQELLAVQLIKIIKNIWIEEGLDLWVTSFQIMITSESSGIIETIKDTLSIHSIRKTAYMKNMHLNKFKYTLQDYFVEIHGEVGTPKFEEAREAFARSLAGYSLITYILALKDRHNGNILVGRAGHLIHIDFGFMLSNSPGYVGFETAPFKLTLEYIELLGGPSSLLFQSFKERLYKGFLALRKHSEKIITPIQIMLPESSFPCFYSGEATLQHLRDRFHLDLTDMQIKEYIEQLVATSSLNMFTRLYDTFQYFSTGVL